MVGCLHRQPAESVFLPAWYAPVDLDSHQAGCSSLPHDKCIASQHHSPIKNRKYVLSGFVCCSWSFLNRFTRRSLSPLLSLEMPLWHKMISTNQAVGIFPKLWLWEARAQTTHDYAHITIWGFSGINKYKSFDAGTEQLPSNSVLHQTPFCKRYYLNSFFFVSY